MAKRLMKEIVKRLFLNHCFKSIRNKTWISEFYGVFHFLLLKLKKEIN